MRYRLIPSPGCPQAFCDRLNAALSMPKARRVYHEARSLYKPYRGHSLDSFQAYLKQSSWVPFGELADILERAAMPFHEAMLLPIRFDLTARP